MQLGVQGFYHGPKLPGPHGGVTALVILLIDQFFHFSHNRRVLIYHHFLRHPVIGVDPIGDAGQAAEAVHGNGGRPVEQPGVSKIL